MVAKKVRQIFLWQVHPDSYRDQPGGLLGGTREGGTRYEVAKHRIAFAGVVLRKKG